MRVCLLAWGSRGDVAPVVSLGAGLREAGHDVTVAAGRDFTPLVAAAGLTAAPFDIDIGAVSRSDAGRAWLAGAGSPAREGARMRAMAWRFAEPAAEGLLATLERHDTVVSGLLTLDPLLAAHRQRGTRHALALFAPLVPTRDGLASVTPVRPTAVSRANLLAGRLLLLAARHALRPAWAAAGDRTELTPLSAREHLRALAATPTLLAASPLVVPPAGDTRRQVLTTGYWPPAGAAESLPAGLAAFLDAGDPPVYLGFGSMPADDPAGAVRLLRDAARSAGRRAVLHGNWGDWAPAAGDLGADVHVVTDAAHHLLFPRCAAVVHHGGAGTTGSAIRAGVPQVVVPHMGDQPYWARRVRELGVGVTPGRRHRLDTGRLARAITEATDPAVAARARDLAARVADEDGVGTAVAHLTRLWSRD